MTRLGSDRYRITFAAAVAVVGLGVSLAPIFAQDGLLAGLGVFALAAVPAAVVIAVVAYIWHGNDTERSFRSSNSDPGRKR